MSERGFVEGRRAAIGSFTLAVVVLAALAGAAVDSKPKARPNSKPKAEPLPALNGRVVAFAQEHLGASVGDGECSSLADEALKAAGARRFPWASTGDYIWGRAVSSIRQALPGDIVQFRDAVFEGRRRLSGGRWLTWRDDYPHHTAIVAEVREGGSEVVLLHQNVSAAGSRPEARRLVQRGSIRPGSLRPGGRIWVYRPIGRDEPPDAAPTARPGEKPSADGSNPTTR